jgi:hypothetical protein
VDERLESGVVADLLRELDAMFALVKGWIDGDEYHVASLHEVLRALTWGASKLFQWFTARYSAVPVVEWCERLLGEVLLDVGSHC